MLSRRISIVAVLVIALMLTVAPIVEATHSVSAGPETADEPRHNQTVPVPFGLYRQPKPIKPVAPVQTFTAVPPPPIGPVWTVNKYVIKSGDTLSAIAPALKSNFSELARCSGISNPNRISIGQIIHKPGTGTCIAPPLTQPAITANAAPINSVSSAAGIVISFAKAQLGDPYVWAGNGPNSWDCSGLMVAAFRQAGVTLPRTSRAQYTVGSSVAYGQWAPGDLLFYGSSASSIHHVALYIGGGQLIHAPQAGDVVRAAAAPAGGGGDYLGAKRVL